MASAGRGGGGRPRRGLQRACGHGGSPGCPGPPAPRGALRERDEMSRQGWRRYQHRHFYLRQRGGPGRSLGELASVPGLATRAPRAPNNAGAGAQRAGVPWDPGCGACPGHASTTGVQCGESSAPHESPSHQAVGEAAPLLFARCPGGARLQREQRCGGSKPPIAQHSWQGGTQAASQPGSTRPSQELPAKVTETGTWEHPCGARGTLGIFFPFL